MRRSLLTLITLTVAIALPSGVATAGSEVLLDGSVAVQHLSYEIYPFVIRPGSMLHPRVSGRLTARGGTGNDIEVFVMSDADLINWKNGHSANTFYNSGRVTVADVKVALPGPGTYAVVVSNTFSGMTPKTVEGRLTLAWDSPPPPESASAAGAGSDDGDGNGLVLLGLLMLAAAVAGGLIVWGIMAATQRRSAQGAP